MGPTARRTVPWVGVAFSTTGHYQSANSYEFAADIPVGVWTHVVAYLVPGVRVSVYVNGVLAGEVTENIGTDPLYTGGGGPVDRPTIQRR